MQKASGAPWTPRSVKKAKESDRDCEQEPCAVGVGCVNADFAAEQTREQRADVEPESGALRVAVELLESLENDSLLAGRDADARVGDGESDVLVLCVEGIGETDRTFVSELSGIAQQVDEHLLDALRVGGDDGVRLHVDVANQLYAGLHTLAHAGDGKVADADRKSVG